ncbi:hypothetical protein ACJJTC_009021 [Scirpophaga incertulas]
MVIIVTQQMSAQAESQKKVYHITDKVMSCSSFLSRLVSSFCNSTYTIVKRDTSILLDKLTHRTSFDYKSKKRWVDEEQLQRVRRQIATECCEQPCTIRQMIKYCPDDAKLVQEHPEIFN